MEGSEHEGNDEEEEYYDFIDYGYYYDDGYGETHNDLAQVQSGEDYYADAYGFNYYDMISADDIDYDDEDEGYGQYY